MMKQKTKSKLSAAYIYNVAIHLHDDGGHPFTLFAKTLARSTDDALALATHYARHVLGASAKMREHMIAQVGHSDDLSVLLRGRVLHTEVSHGD